MHFLRPFRLSLAASAFAPVVAFAQERMLIVDTGSSATFWEIADRVIVYLSGAISTIAVVMFVIGALMITVSGVKEDYRQTGKNLMIGAVLSLAVVLGAYALLRTVDYFLTA